LADNKQKRRDRPDKDEGQGPKRSTARDRRQPAAGKAGVQGRRYTGAEAGGLEKEASERTGRIPTRLSGVEPRKEVEVASSLHKGQEELAFRLGERGLGLQTSTHSNLP